MNRRGFLKTLLMLPVAALIKPKEVPQLVAELGRFKGIKIFCTTLMPKWYGEWVGYSDLEAEMSAKMGEQMALSIDEELLMGTGMSKQVARMYQREFLRRDRPG